MSAPAVIQGCYADYRRVKGRKVFQMVIEVPAELAPQVHTIFGEPSPDGSTWVAVALLDPNVARVPVAAEQPSQAPQKPASGRNGSGGASHRLAQQAALCCQDARFHKFLMERVTNMLPEDADEAAFMVRVACGVESRREFDTDPEAAARWRDLHSRYIAWREAP